MKRIIYLGIIVFLTSCGTTKEVVQTALLNEETFLLTKISKDPTYGFKENNPIKVGGVDKDVGPLNERRFLNALAGPNGEKVWFNRVGSCCAFDSENGFMGKGLLDNYSVTYEGANDTVSIYINMYDYGELKAPVGFTCRK
jgi:hypothetical protein